MSPTLFGALRGPIFLIGVGLLFIADQLGRFSLGDTWPALLILFGVLKLLERLAQKSAEPPEPPQYTPPQPPQYPPQPPQYMGGPQA